MCRWFAYISPTEPCLLEDVLITPPHSLVKQVHERYLPKLIHHDPNGISQDALITARNVLFNIDGLGIVWYTNAHANFVPDDEGTHAENLRPAMYKTTQPPLNDLNFRSICANTETRVCFGHIRAASSTAITQVNNHPFVFGRHAFMHNGVVSDFPKVQRKLLSVLSDAAFSNILGSTDSECLAALYMTNLTNGAGTSSFEQEYTIHEMITAMETTIEIVILQQQAILGKNARPNSLNLCTTDGIKVVAVRFRNHVSQEPPTLYYSTKAGVTLNRKYPGRADGREDTRRSSVRPVESHGRHIIVASEPSTYAETDWELIPRNHFVSASAGEIEVFQYDLPASMCAEDRDAPVQHATSAQQHSG